MVWLQVTYWERVNLGWTVGLRLLLWELQLFGILIKLTMKEKIEEIVVYHGKENILRRYFELDTPTEDIMKIFEVSFPQEFKLWSRELIGGNRGAHKIND
jgi:hypothetical protein